VSGAWLSEKTTYLDRARPREDTHTTSDPSIPTTVSPYLILTHGPDAVANSRDQGQDEQQNEEVENLPVHLTLNSRSFNRCIPTHQRIPHTTHVAFRINFVSCPALIATPYTQPVFRNCAPRNNSWLGPTGILVGAEPGMAEERWNVPSYV
jgi:hypothetical protein